MSKIVVKFGGSNLRDWNDISKIIDIIKQYNQPITIAVSALYGTTNELDHICKEVINNKESINKFCTNLFKKYNNISKQLLHDENNRKEYIRNLNLIINTLKESLLGIHYLKFIPKQTNDKVLVTGEILSSNIIHYALKDENIINKILYPEHIGLQTNGIYNCAEIDLNKSSQKIPNYICFNEIVIIPGFYGVSDRGQINLLGRGGTDYSASALAHCLKADYLDIWKDVNGFCSADPKIIEDVHSIKQLSYTEAAELAYFGANILHPSSIAPVQSRNIPTRILDIRKNNCLIPVTTISSEISKESIKSVTSSNDFGIIKLKGASIGYKQNVLAEITNKLSEHNINISSVITSQVAINIIINKQELEKAKKLINDLNISIITKIEIQTDISLIAVVGEGISDTCGIASRIFSALSQQSINIKICSLGASVVSIYIIIDSLDHRIALETIHHELFNTNINHKN